MHTENAHTMMVYDELVNTPWYMLVHNHVSHIDDDLCCRQQAVYTTQYEIAHTVIDRLIAAARVIVALG